MSLTKCVNMDTNNTSNETNNGSISRSDSKRQQFTNKQRMDMYAFCVLELEMHSNKVSIKKQQQAIQKVLSEQHKDGDEVGGDPAGDASNQNQLQLLDQSINNETNGNVHNHASNCNDKNHNNNNNQLTLPSNPSSKSPSSSSDHTRPNPTPNGTVTRQQHPPTPQTMPNQNQIQQNRTQNLQLVPHPYSASGDGGDTFHQELLPMEERDSSSTVDDCNQNGIEGKTLLQLQQEVAMSRKCYSDYQKTQVLTSSMLRDVQKRFAKYYPDSAIPSRTTIKHLFEKCVAHGTVENIKTPRKTTKIPQGDEIEYLLIHEPRLSLRQLAQKLNVSTGTVSRRCRALGLVPESVTIKHQQMATARRNKQMKNLENQTVRAIAQISDRADGTNGQANSS